MLYNVAGVDNEAGAAVLQCTSQDMLAVIRLKPGAALRVGDGFIGDIACCGQASLRHACRAEWIEMDVRAVVADVPLVLKMIGA